MERNFGKVMIALLIGILILIAVFCRVFLL